MIYKNWGLRKKKTESFLAFVGQWGRYKALEFLLIIRVELPFWKNFGGSGELLQEYIDWPSWSKWISLNFIAQLVEHCSTNAQANRIPLKSRYIYIFFLGGGGGGRELIFSCLNCNYTAMIMSSFKFVFPHFTSSSWKLNFSLPISLIIYIDLARAKSKAPVNKFIFQIKQ